MAILRARYGEIELVRSRDPERLADCDLRVDVGSRYDPEHGDFDHHQKGGAGSRPNGVPFASFGLVWKSYGEELCGSAVAAAEVDRILVAPIDAADTGYRHRPPVSAETSPFTVSHLIASLNPLWDEDLDPELQDRRFEEARSLAGAILARQIEIAQSWQRAEPELQSAIAKAVDARIVEFTRRLPWRHRIAAAAPKALFIVCPYPDAWGVHAVRRYPRDGGEKEARLPRAWAGLSGAELAKASGVPDAVFCHTGRFFASAASRKGALALARGALEQAA